MRVVLVAVVTSACGFSPTIVDVQGDAQSGPGPVASACNTHAPGVRLCLDFEAPNLVPVIDDVSGRGNNADALFVTGMPRAVPNVAPSRAAELTPQSTIAVHETDDLDIATNLSIEMWLRAYDPSAQSWPLYNDGQYAIAIDDSRLSCEIAGHDAHADDVLTPGQWAHVACTYDGATIKLYVDGDLVDCTPQPGMIADAGFIGTTIGFGYVGGIDDVHVYAHTLSDAEVRVQAGAAPGPTACPQ